MSQLTLINELDESTLPPLELPVWLVIDNGMYIGCRTTIADGENYTLWLYGLCDYYLHDNEWKCSNVDCDDYHPTAWMELPNVTDLLSQLNKEN